MEVNLSLRANNMNLPILIEPVAGNGFRSRGGEPFAPSAEGATRAEVLVNLQDQLQTLLSGGAQLLSIESTSPAVANPWVEYAGMFQDDPYFAEWQQAIAANPQRVENDAEIP